MAFSHKTSLSSAWQDWNERRYWSSLLQTGLGGCGTFTWLDSQMLHMLYQIVPIFCLKNQSAILLVGLNSMAIEDQVLGDRGILELVVPTMLNAILLLAKSIIGLGLILTWCEFWVFYPRKFSVGQILSSLQLGLEQSLCLGALKGQVSALVILFHRLLASHSLIKNLFRQFPMSLSLFVPLWLQWI